MTLKDLKKGESAVITTVGGQGALRQHFLDMGVIPGAEVTLIKYAPMGDPMELTIHGYELTLRLADAEKIGIDKHYDILIQTIVAAMASAIMWIASMTRWFGIFGGLGRDRRDGNAIGWLFVALLSPIAAILIQAAISRSREYLADDYSRKLMGSGEYLVSALNRISGREDQILEAQGGSAISDSTAHMFIYSPKASFVAKLFSTHPSLEERVENLRK